MCCWYHSHLNLFACGTSSWTNCWGKAGGRCGKQCARKGERVRPRREDGGTPDGGDASRCPSPQVFVTI